MSLKNKVALVTGSSSGIGAAIAIKFTQEGAKVVIVGRNKTKLKNVSDACEKLGAKPLTIAADITKEYEAISIVTETIGYFGKLDILVNNAGVGGAISIMDNNAMELFDRLMTTNLHSAVRLTHLAAKHLVESKGNIVNISSVASSMVMQNAFAYCVSKAALDHFTRSIALELSPKGVRVNSVNPGPVRTDILDGLGLGEAGTNHVWEAMKKTTLLNRVADAEEVADLVAFVVGNSGRSITGAILFTDNGTLIKGPTDFMSADS